MALLTLAVLGGALSAWTVLDRGWVPHDEGTLGIAAERVLHGDLPHRDFSDPYTGGLSYWHALAMRVFGVSFMAPRYALFVAFALWLPAIWWLARRACGRRWATIITIIAACWSLPIYPAAMPSWYLMFLCTWVVVALERWHASRHAGWLLLTGLLCGIAVTVKQTGLYLVAGTLLGVLFCNQDAARLQWPHGRPAGRTDPFILLLLATLGALVLKLLWGLLGSGELLHLVAPISAILALAAMREWRLTNPEAPRWGALLRDVGLLVTAAAVPVLLFLVPYAGHGGFGDLYAGVIGEGIRRIATLRREMPAAENLLLAVWPVYLLLLVAAFSGKRRALQLAALAGTIVLLVLSFRGRGWYMRMWFFSLSVLPVTSAALLVAGYRAWRRQRALDPVLLALAGITAFQALNQFPFSAPVYYVFVAPLAVVTAAAAAAHFRALPRVRLGFLLLAGFGVFLRLGSIYNLGVFPAWWDFTHRLAVQRAGLLMAAPDSARYTHALELVARHRADGSVFAGPQLPAVYFLTGTRSPGRDSYSMFSQPVADSTELPRAFNPAAANVIVINTSPADLPALGPDVYRWLAVRYPWGESFDGFEVRWRAPR